MIYLQPSPRFKHRFTVAAVYLVHEDKILLLHRQDHTSQGNKWGIPGGKVQNEETALEGAIREIREETGFDISDQYIEDLGAIYIEYTEEIHFVYHMFRTTLVGDPGSVRIQFSEHKGFTWVTPEDSLKMDLLQDEDPCIRLVYFPQTYMAANI